MKNRHLLSAFLALLTLFSCSGSAPNAPMCRSETSVVIHEATAAGCLVKVNNSILFIRHRLTGRLDIPGGGQQEGESLACTAHRETWEETGINVNVIALIGKTTNGMVIFHCSEKANLASLPDVFNAPDWAKTEVSELVIANLYNLSEDDLRYHDDLVPLRDAFTQIQSNK